MMRLPHAGAQQAATIERAVSITVLPPAIPNARLGDRSMRVFELAVAGIAIVVAVLVSIAR